MTTVNVRAEKGCGRFEAEFPFGGRKIFFAAKTHILRRNGVSYQVPAGVAYVLNRELEKRTNGKVTHELVEQGLYHLLRLTVYAARGSSDEIEEMYARRGQIRKEASELLESGLMPADEHARILGELEVLEAQFSPPKRVEQKLVAAKHLGKAHDLRASGDRRKIAPSSMTAYAASKRVTLRIRDLEFISRYFSGGTMRISAQINAYREAIEDISEFFERPSKDARGPRDRGAFFRLMDGLDIPAGHASALSMLRHRLANYAASMSGLTFMPYRDVCRRIALLLGDIDSALVRDIIPSARRSAVIVRSLTRQLRMIHVIETTLVAQLSWYLARMPKNIRSLAVLR